jgi:4-amino-4-deoxy-L-arabinose transferase-like glycosyltransferase
MNTSTNTTIRQDIVHSLASQQQSLLAKLLAQWELLLVIALALVALIPRIILATQLDVVTDEIVYILGGKVYLPLLLHLSIGNRGWMINYEHPPVVKLLIGTSLAINHIIGHPLNGLLAARIPSILGGTALVVIMYLLGRRPFGHVVSLLAALTLAASPWLVYFSALAYLDMTMTMFATIAVLLIWHAIYHPKLYLLVALFIGLGAASKYTAVLVVPSMFIFTAYYFFVLRLYLPKAQRPRLPWRIWIAAIIGAPLLFLLADPAIWPSPIALLLHSFDFEWNHSIHGHLTFLAGQYSTHVPPWSILYILLVKLSIFVTIPAAFFVLYALVQLVRFHWRHAISVEEASSIAFLLIWLVTTAAMFSLLNIVVGTHYELPAAPPTAFAGAFGMTVLWRYRRGSLFAPTKTTNNAAPAAEPAISPTPTTSTLARPLARARFNPAIMLIAVAMLLLMVLPHLIGLVTIPDAEGYTSEIFQGENSALQVAYPGYRNALIWLSNHISPDQGRVSIGLVALVDTLSGQDGVSWYSYNEDFVQRYKLVEAHPTDATFPYDYLVWPMHLVQRGYKIPSNWRTHIVHIIMGGNTIYCFIMARNPGTIITQSQ